MSQGGDSWTGTVFLEVESLNGYLRHLRFAKELPGGSSHLVSRLQYIPSYKWINPTYPIYNWGYNLLMIHQAVSLLYPLDSKVWLVVWNMTVIFRYIGKNHPN